MVPSGCAGRGEDKPEERQQQQGQILALVLAALRKSVVLPCQMADADDPAGAAWGMEIGWPTDVRHVAHVTFDRLHGFLGLPVEFELEIPGQVPSARYRFRNPLLHSALGRECSVSFLIADVSLNLRAVRVCLGYRRNRCSVATTIRGTRYPRSSCSCKKGCTRRMASRCIFLHFRLVRCELERSRIVSFLEFLLHFQAEGIFRIAPENSQEEHVREQLNSGIVPDDIDVHCLASLIKVNDMLCASLRNNELITGTQLTTQYSWHD